jgi:alkyl hydroperoxide reductase subunit AhpF
MGMIDAKTAQKIKDTLAKVADPVTLTVFTKEHECAFCQQTRGLVEELAALSEKLVIERFDLEKDHETAARYGVERAPAIVVHGKEDRGIRYYGIPAGYEFSTLLESILDFGITRPSPLSPQTQASLKGVTKPAKIQVFFTPQ